jgi:hypothetical protein
MAQALPNSALVRLHHESAGHRDSKETWFCSLATCKEENPEAFAGQQVADVSSSYVFDERQARRRTRSSRVRRRPDR